MGEWETYRVELIRCCAEGAALHEWAFWVHESLTKDQAMGQDHGWLRAVTEYLLKLYIELTARPTEIGIKEYAKRFSRLPYDQQGELSFLIHSHFHGPSCP